MKEKTITPFGTVEVDIARVEIPQPGIRLTAQGNPNTGGVENIEVWCRNLSSDDSYRQNLLRVIGAIADGSIRDDRSGLELLIARRRLEIQPPVSPKQSRVRTTRHYSYQELEAHLAKSNADDHAALLREGTPEA